MVDKQRILIVDDDANIAELISLYLMKECYETKIVGDGESALREFPSFKPNLVLLDLMLPGIDGYQVCRELRTVSQVPIIMLSAKGEIFDKVLGLDAGANDYLTKPFNSRELLARIRAMTRTQAAQANSQLHIGNVVLDRATYELSTPSGSYRLANKEFQMMEMLMSNPKNLISSERFMEKIWGYDSEAEINVVWVYISYLRKKLAALHANIQIKAMRNAGYTLEEIV